MTDDRTKPFVERLREWASRSPKATGARNRAAFLATKADVEAALADGWRVSQIWELLTEEGRISFSYAWFAKFVRSEIRNPRRPIGAGRSPSTSSPASIAPAVADDAQSKPAPPQQTFKVTPTPNKKDLI